MSTRTYTAARCCGTCTRPHPGLRGRSAVFCPAWQQRVSVCGVCDAHEWDTDKEQAIGAEFIMAPAGEQEANEP